ncbi:hypothetical protein [Streptococcus suis]|nr:hypothetical protein [Streptococcus suis]MDW8767671.1 hypothetical protein [Streptococcus suis]NQH85765.1 hypothetical protein [Streptococcus suis]NQN16533.1 hypothetical protein [Streptococcus suis]NQR71857.1 hypothetical protein [Streptococcus suis]
MKGDQITRKYLQNTKQVYKDFCKLYSNLEGARKFINEIPIELLPEYREIIFAENEKEKSVSTHAFDLLITIILSSFISLCLPKELCSAILFLSMVSLVSLCFIIFMHTSIESINKHRLLDFLERYDISSKRRKVSRRKYN